ncbi:MAG: FAD-dependent oxidoreductase [Acidimicrobiia bacterium]
MRIAIVGTGVSGLVAAHELAPHHEITVFEADSRVGGHANTVDVDLDGRRHAVDTGFIVYNEANYPGFIRLLDQLGVPTRPTDMSFGVSVARTGLEYRGSNLNTLFAQRANLARPAFLRMLVDIVRFNRSARRLVQHEVRWGDVERLPTRSDDSSKGSDDDTSIAEFLRRGRYSDTFVSQFLVPFGAAIWSADPETFTRFPMRSYARFMDNHGLLGLAGRPQWRTVCGGSRTYVEALIAPISDRIRLNTPVEKIVHRTEHGESQVEVLTAVGAQTFDRVIIAAHSDQALRMLGDASSDEQEILGAIKYQPNRATLHTDERLLPRAHLARASWNYWVAPDEQRATVTYWMNLLQGIESTRPLLLTLNRTDAIDPEHILAEFEYDHPVFDAGALRAQRRRYEIQGTRGRYFVGAYWGYGFHEDGVQSALEVVRAVGADS